MSKNRYAPRTLRTALAAAAIALLAACTTVGPDYHVPAQAAVNRPEASAPFAGVQDSKTFLAQAVPGDWWRLYDDAALNALVAKALDANTDLRVAAANLERADAVLREARAQTRPGVTVNASPTYGHVSGVQELAPDYRPPNAWSYSGSAGISYQVDLVGQIRRAIEAAGADRDAAQAAYDATRAAVAAQTTRAYTTACAAGMQLASAQHSVDVQNESLRATERLQRLGRGTTLDVTRARSQLEQLRANLPPLQAQQRTALFQLATLTGDTPAQFPPELANCAALPALRQPIPVGDGASLLRRRADIRQAERSLAAANARIGVATADLYPKITLGLSAGSAGPAQYFGDAGTFSWSIGPLISWTLPNTGAVQARIAEAEAGTRAAYARFDATVLNALRETESALENYARELDRDAALRAARDQSAEAASQATTLYRYGKTDYLTVLDAQRTLASNESALAASQAQLANDQITLFLALGGGWQTGR
ncbi:efflux transporter outer membrane subunit [Bordetella bronchialis]|uniref:RND transporter n=1 Tax=Bordetella bronchialis TaxID=463025 RepID=A0A193G4R6_9BORD|nr:efflux transporter outer membrane subunit [Bordetella bronchialis]ANN74830.1 RND transporter [Bordetella bronchialis]